MAMAKTLKGSDYERIACRGIAAGQLEIIQKALSSMRLNAESAGVHVNERVNQVTDILDEIARDFYAESWADRLGLRTND